MAAYLGPKENNKNGGGAGSGGGGGGGGDDGDNHKNKLSTAGILNTKKNKKKKGGAATPSLKDCANCGAGENTIPGITMHKPCKRCMITYYCSVGCQKQHWKEGGHKQNCVPMKDRSVEKMTSDDKKKKGASSRGGIGGGAAAEEEEGRICAICQYPLSEEPYTKMPCSHVYHVACVEKLRSYDIKQVCPVCRVDLPPGPQQLVEEAVRRYWVLDRRYGQGVGKPWRRISNDADRRENAEVVRMMTEAAEQGNSMAQNEVGVMHRFGQGVPQNDVVGVEWYRKAADQGNSTAQFNVGIAYQRGTGVPHNYALAAEWIHKAADQGYAIAQHNLGVMYLYGQGVPQNLALAVEWYRKAADQGNGNAMVGLAEMHHFGHGGLRPDSSKALMLLRKALALGCDEAKPRIEQVLQAQHINEPQQEPPPSSVTPANSPPSPIPIGTRVELHGLKVKKLNRQRGEVVGFDTASGRCEVKLEDGRGPYGLKPENLKELA